MHKQLAQKNRANWLTISMQSLDNYPDAVPQIYQEQMPGMVIKQVFSQSEMREVSQKIKSQKTGLHSTRYGETIGLSLSQKVTSDSNYFQEADSFRTALTQLFSTDFESTIESVIGKISGGIKVEIPQENGSYYTPATIRFVPPKRGGIPPQTGSDFLYNPGYDYFKSKAELADSLSYFVIIERAEAGGELILYDLFFSQSDKEQKELKEFFKKVKQDIEKFPQTYLDPDVGDMVIFKGSTIMHKVADVSEEKTRISIGGFFAFSQDNQKIYYWS